MGKKTTGSPRQRDGTQQPTPSGRRRSQNASSPLKSGQQRVNTKGKRKRKKNEIILEGNTDYGDRYSSQDGFDSGAEDVLRKKRPRESALHYSTPLPPAKAPISPYKRRLKRILFYGVTLLAIISIGVLLSLTVFFKIESISVEGETRYDSAKIIEASMIQEGENFFLCNTSTGEQKIWKDFPYIESVRIEKKLFNRIVISVQEAVPSYVIESSGSYVLLSESGKIIDISNKKQADVPIIMGAKLAEPALSASVKYQDDNVEGYLEEILTAAQEYKIGELKVIDITSLAGISVETKEGFHIILGSPESISYKMMTAHKIMKKDVPEGDTGTLDVSLSAVEGGKSYFNSRKPVKQESSAQPSQQPETSRKPQTSKPESSSAVSGQSSKPSQQSSRTSQPPSESSAVSSETAEVPSESSAADENTDISDENTDTSDENTDISDENTDISDDTSSGEDEDGSTDGDDTNSDGDADTDSTGSDDDTGSDDTDTDDNGTENSGSTDDNGTGDDLT